MKVIDIEVRTEKASRTNFIILKCCLELTMNTTVFTRFLSKTCKDTNFFFLVRN